MMLVPTPPKLCENNMSPNYHHRHYTTPRSSQQYDSPMLTPSPLRQTTTSINASLYNPLQSPCKPTAQVQAFNPFLKNIPQPIPADDEEGSIFLSSAASDSFTSFFSSSSSKPLRTPVKQGHRARSRSILSPKSVNTAIGPISPSADPKCATRVGVGTKRKSTPHATPLRQHHLTPLKLTNVKDSFLSPPFVRLAPLAAPKFSARTPQTKAETDMYLKRQTATMTKLKISDNTNIMSDDEFEGLLSDSGCEMDNQCMGNALFLGRQRLSIKGTQPLKSLVFHPPVSKGKEKEEVAEAISPGGHIVKRRARSRPVSAELLESSFKSPKSPSKSAISMKRSSTNRLRNAVAFPGTVYRTHASPASPDAGSPRARRRISGNEILVRPKTSQLPQMYPSRTPLSRVESASSATLFFGPLIPPAHTVPRSRTNTSLSAATPAPVPRRQNTRGNLTNRHSYAGPESSANALHAWSTLQTRNVSPSPRSSPCHVGDSSHHDTDMEGDENMFTGPGDSSFVLNVTSGTPSPQSKKAPPMKFKHRNSLLVSDEDEILSTGSSATGDFLQAIPKASTSASSICSDDGLVTPGAAPEGYSGWPTATVYNGADDALDNQHSYGLSSEAGVDVDAFIIKTLAAASKAPQLLPKRIPGTPVKKIRMSYFGNERPWQSAVASKVGLRDEREVNKKVPRKSLPAVFPPTGARRPRLNCDQTTDSEDEQESPITRRDRYANLGLGLGQSSHPSGTNVASGIPRSRWLMRRSSSGVFSSGSDSASLENTPTRSKGIDWHLPKPRIPLSPSGDVTSRSNSGSSCSSIATLNSPTNGKRSTGPSTGTSRHLNPRPTLVARRLSDSFAEEQPGRFERDFVEIEEVGSGEFGKVIKVQRKGDDNVDLYAIKKSKRFEGTKHRLRLREEVDVLKHLSQAALSSHGAGGRHPNVLAYIDSWEEDEALYIRTELCELGNLARFLWEYGRVFPRLDEARVWKVIVDLSNGLRFIHDSGVIHLDLKPSNVFVTKEGRFKIGDFGMASFWPRPMDTASIESGSCSSFEREGDKLYLAPEVLQGRYGKAADVFSLGMMILETASNIVVPDQGEAWHRLRREDLSQVDLDESPELVDIIKGMMRSEPRERLSAEDVYAHPVVARTRAKMEELYEDAQRTGTSVFVASALASVPSGFLEDVLCGMDTRV